jgi:DNA-binding NarL/FixJ family response regulator
MSDTQPLCPGTPAHIRLLLVDIHATSRRSMRNLLDLLPGLKVVGETGEYQEALSLLAQLQPDIVLISMRVQGSTGPDTVREILKLRPQTRIVFITLFFDVEYVNSALAAGAHAYVLKHEPASEVQKAIDMVVRGETYLSPGLGQLP